MRRIFKLGPVRISILLSVAIIIMYLSGIPFLDVMEMKAYDFRFKSRGNLRPGEEVVIVTIDEKSLDALGRWPWPRSTVALLVDKLSEYGARVIGFDIVFPEPEENSFIRNVGLIKEKLESDGAEHGDLLEYLEQLQFEADNDAHLARALKASDRVVMGFFFHFQKEGLEHLDEETLQRYLATIEFSNYEQIYYTSKLATEVHFLEGYAVESNIDVISNAVKDFGYFNFVPDSDGVVRKLPLLIEYRGDQLFPGANLFPPLSIKMLAEYWDSSVIKLEINELGLHSVKLGDKIIPADEKGMMLINYMGGQKIFPHYSIIDIFNGVVPPEAIKDKIVLVGATAVGIYDVRVTPFEPNFPGVEIHATVIDNILHDRFIVKPEWTQDADIAIILTLGLILGFLLRRAKAATGIIALVVTGVAFAFFNRYVFVEMGLWLNFIYPSLNIVGTFAGITIFRYMTEEKEKKFIKGAFAQYLAPDVVNRLIEDPSMLKLGGERKVLTAFFSDVAGFTAISEKLTPEELVALLNEYLTEMSDILLDNKGTIDKYEGDAIVAFFGAPVYHEEHARLACLTSIRMQERLMVLRESWKEQGRPELHVRIGLNTGPMVVGNMGSKDRMDYTMMGDTVNLAARLEAGAKQYGIFMMIGEETYAQAREYVEVRELDLLRVVGKSEPVRVYELLGEKDKVNPIKMEQVKLYSEGVENYRVMNWDGAIDLFNQALALDGGDPPSQVYIERCEKYKTNPPPDDWGGIHIMTQK